MSQIEPLVSIIIPTRNRKELLLDAVHSALAQTYKNLQIVVHDNYSTDGTERYLRDRIDDPRFEYYRSSVDLSMTENWNAAFSKIKGEFFVRLDDDNVISNDFIASALEQVWTQDYDLVIYSPLVVNLHHKISTLFEPESKIFTLQRLEEVYFEYFNLIDSNYAFYKMSFVRSLFPDGKVYQTTLPDRFMGYSLMSAYPELRVGFSSAVKGVTRFDYRAPYGSEYHLTYVDYDHLSIADVLKQKDCLNNFHMHRANTLAFFLKCNPDSEVSTFFKKRILAPGFERVLMKLGHIYMARDAYTWKEFMIYNRYVFEIIGSLFMRPFACFEGRNLLINVAAIGRNVLLANLRSFGNLFLGKKRCILVPEPEEGNTIVREMIAGQSVNSHIQFSSHGRVETFLKKIS